MAQIRQSNPQDAKIAAELFSLSNGEFGTAMFGLGDYGLNHQALERLFLARTPRFGSRWCEMAEIDGKTAGVLHAFPGRQINWLNLGIVRHLAAFYGLKRSAEFISRAMYLFAYKECEPDEFYISNLAVLPEHQGQGIGSALLARAEAKAAQEGLSRLSLEVDLDNPSARRLYERIGYQVVETVETPHLVERLAIAGYMRMRKIL